MDNQVLVTGVGFVTSKGYEYEKLWHSLCLNPDAYLSEIGPIECPPNDLTKRFIGLNASAVFGVGAVKLAWDDAFNSPVAIDRCRWGVYCGTAFGGFTKSEEEQCRELLQNGPGGLLPGVFNNTGYHIIPDIVAIDFKISGANITFVSGELASGMALMQGYDDIKYGDLQGAIVVGVEVKDHLITSGYETLGVKDAGLFSSGACSVLLQSLAECQIETIQPRALIRAVETVALPSEAGSLARMVYKSIAAAIDNALNNAGIKAESIDMIVSGEGNGPIEKLNYQKAYLKVFGKKKLAPWIFDAQKALGNVIGAGPIMGMGLALMFIDKQAVPYQNRILKKEIRYVLVTANNPEGNAWAMVLERYYAGGKTSLVL